MSVPLRIFAVLSLLLAPGHSADAGTPDLTGKWAVDLEASDSLVPILELLGRSWMERKLASHAEVKNIVSQTADLVLIKIRAPFYSETERLALDGEWHEHEQKLTGKYSSRTFWKAGTLITENRLELPDGEPALLTVERSINSLSDRLQQTTYLKTKGQELQARRVWRREAE